MWELWGQKQIETGILILHVVHERRRPADDQGLKCMRSLYMLIWLEIPLLVARWVNVFLFHFKNNFFAVGVCNDDHCK